jgi:hypothetical protein
MGILANDLRALVIRPTLEQLDDWSPAAENLLLGTAAQESQLGNRLQNGPIHSGQLQRQGLYRISANTHLQVWDQFLIGDPELASRLRGLASQQQFLKTPHQELVTNLSYATGVAWMVYKRHRVTLPDARDIDALANCWLQYFAKRDCNADESGFNVEVSLEKFKANYRQLVLRDHKTLAA